jgi:hypothetical protein
MQAKGRYAMVRVKWSDYEAAVRIRNLDGRTLSEIVGLAIEQFEKCKPRQRFDSYVGRIQRNVNAALSARERKTVK